MRLVVLTAALMMLAGCAAPPSDGGLWSRQGQQRELAISRISDQERARIAHDFELQLADETLTSFEQAVQACEGQATAGGAVLDGVRVRVGDDQPRVARAVRLVAALDFLRQGNCQQARAALDALPNPSPTAATATVTRSPGYPGHITQGDSTQLLVEYALGWTDTVRAPAPLAQHLARLYGGDVLP
jgi:hypothetical protein